MYLPGPPPPYFTHQRRRAAWPGEELLYVRLLANPYPNPNPDTDPVTRWAPLLTCTLRTRGAGLYACRHKISSSRRSSSSRRQSSTDRMA
eukprot:scaffold44342_cov35-Phaeocystis_antarctica.AAC.1